MATSRTGAGFLFARIRHRSQPPFFSASSSHVPPSSKRFLGIPPQYLLDDYTPRYQLLTPIQIAQKRSSAYAHLRNCNLCPRLCGVNRYERTGICLIGATHVKVNVIAPHRGEEPCIQGHHGSGAVFFSGCNLRCVFCQNHDIAHQRNGFDLTPEELAEWMIKLQNVGNVHNINFVTPEHVVPQVALAVLAARDMGLRIPIIYNTSSFDSLESLNLMDGIVDIYLPDLKVWDPSTSRRLLKAENYAEVARESIREMYRQVGDLSFTSDGVAQRGVLVRHLIMPGMEEEGKEIVRWLASHVSQDLYLHVMEQYHPDAHVGKPRRKGQGTRTTRTNNEVVDLEGGTISEERGGSSSGVRYAEINRAVTTHEVGSVKQAAEEAGLWRFCDVSDQPGFHL